MTGASPSFMAVWRVWSSSNASTVEAGSEAVAESQETSPQQSPESDSMKSPCTVGIILKDFNF